MALSDDELRERFSPYHDRELPQAEHDAVRDALEKNPALAREYKDFCAMLDGLGSLGAPKAPTPLLQGVQTKLHKRSGGRFYRDRWSRTAGLFPVELLAALLLIALVVAYFAMTSIQVRTPPPTAPYVAPPPSSPPATTPAR
ncbi:MAG: hypothetical protein HY909_24880 [Deltaproteobacteria bacterium]|nr:hypothetical protein [Deltaproteobacteria bacterium]